jgi:hypothetical protein
MLLPHCPKYGHRFYPSIERSFECADPLTGPAVTLGPLPSVVALMATLQDKLHEARRVFSTMDKLANSSSGHVHINTATELLYSACALAVKPVHEASTVALRSCFIDALVWQHRARLVLAGLMPTPSGLCCMSVPAGT